MSKLKWICTEACDIRLLQKPDYQSFFSGLFLLLIPKCAACWASYMLVITYFGLGHLLSKPWVMYLVMVLLVITAIKQIYATYVKKAVWAAILLLTGFSAIIANRWLPGYYMFDVAGSTMIMLSILSEPLINMYYYLRNTIDIDK